MGIPLVPEEEPVVPEQVALGAVRPPPLIFRDEPGGPKAPPRAAPADRDDLDEPLSLVDRLRSLDPGTAAAFLCLSLSLLSVSLDEVDFLAKPLAGLGLLIGLLGGVLLSVRKGAKVVAPAVVSGLCLLALLFVGSWPTSPAPPPAVVAVSLGDKGMSANQPAGEEDWVDASTSAVRRDDVRVQVVSARVTPVDLKKQSSSSTTSERFLVIHLRASYEGVVFKQVPYEPWADRADAPSKNPPTLADDRGHNYEQKTFDGGWKVAGRADADALTPGHQVKEVLVYPAPPAEVEFLRLALPAAAFGGQGEYRFRLPRAMIKGK